MFYKKWGISNISIYSLNFKNKIEIQMCILILKTNWLTGDTGQWKRRPQEGLKGQGLKTGISL